MDRLRRRRHKEHAAPIRARPVMNVTPLVDVVLVLLIIFMVVIPALQQGATIEMPGVFNVDEPTEKKAEPFKLSIDKDGQLYFEDEIVNRKTLETKLRAASKREPARRVVVRADKAAEYTQVRDIYLIAQQVGFPGVSLRVNKRNTDAPEANHHGF
jgi:biopolymer transport protein ExbD